MTACAKCGFDPDAVIKSGWVFHIDRDPPSLNARLFNSGARAFAYRKERDAWIMFFRLNRLNSGIPLASGKRRVTLTRMYSGRQQVRDVDNLVGGMKAIVDAMVFEKLLISDAPAYSEIHYKQERVAAKTARGLRVHLEAL